MFFGLNNRAQSSSPFELLVAVTIMIFVILIGTQAMAKLDEAKCQHELEKNMQNFKFALEKIVDPGTPAQLSFNPPSCYKGEKITLVQHTGASEHLCSMLCEEPRSECVTLEYVSEGGPGIRMCVKIPITTYFEQADNCADPTDLALGYSIKTIDYDDPISKGIYFFRNKTMLGEAFQRLCVYRKVKTP